MERKIPLKYFNAALHIGMSDWRTVYLLEGTPVQLYPEVYRGNLTYRARGSAKRFSYKQIKQGLKKHIVVIKETVPAWL